MKRLAQVLFLTIFCCCVSYAQTGHDHLTCGTPPGKSDWLIKYQKSPHTFSKRSGDVLWVPLAVTIVANDDGTGLVSELRVVDNLCDLNSDFADADIQFYLGRPISYLYNSEYANHNNFQVATDMMFTHNTENMINIYLTPTGPSGTAGYNLPYAGIVVTNGSVSGTSDTWAHEIGHNLAIPHPFLGWEGGRTHDGSQPPNYALPAPEIVTYDYTNFKDQPYWDTLIIDTAYVEYVDGSNCEIAADGFCDTPADYLTGGGWPCNGDGESNQEQTDPSGAKFRSDATLIMSYSGDACSSRFTQDQNDAMRANLVDEKSAYLEGASPIDPPDAEEASINVPNQGSDFYYKDAYLEWDAIEGAESYLVHFSLSSTFGFNAFDTIVYNNYIDIDEFRFENKKHYMRVKPLNPYNLCNDYQMFTDFFVTDVETSVKELEIDMELFPSVVNRGRNIHIQGDNLSRKPYTIVNAIGETVVNGRFDNDSNVITTFNMQAGLYFVHVSDANKLATLKFVITE